MGLSGRLPAATGVLLATCWTSRSYATPCPSYSRPAQVGTVADATLVEASGLAVSRKNPGVLWAHNDSGDSARVFALATGGALLGVYDIAGAAAVDWEDIAIGPGPEAHADS